MSQTSKTIISVIIIILIILGIMALNKGKKDVGSGPIKIGAVLPLTGAGAGIGELIKEGLDWKIEELNQVGGNYQLLVEDSQSDIKQAVSALNKLADVDKVKIVFTTTSASGMALKPAAISKGVLLWADITHPEFTKDNPLGLRHSNVADKDAEVLAKSVLENSPKKVAVIYQQDDWGKVLNNYLVQILGAKGVEVISEGVDNKSTDFKSVVTKIKAEKPDGIVYGVFGSALGILIKQTRELSYVGKLYSGVGFVLTPDAQKVAGTYAKDLTHQTYKDNENFNNDYRTRFDKEPGALSYITYTDLELLDLAIRSTNSTEPDKISGYIKSLGQFKGKYEEVEISPLGDIIVPTVMKVW